MEAREKAFHESIHQLTVEQIERILSNLDSIVYDEHAYENSTGKW